MSFACSAFFPQKSCGAAKMVSSYGRPAASSLDKDLVPQKDLSFCRWRTKLASPIHRHTDLYERERLVVTRSKFILVEGPLQNQSGMIHVKASRLRSLFDQTLEVRSHDFH
jgi:hypothetical protein